MTGYGLGEVRAEGGRWVVEARSVNHRFLEVNVRLPRSLQALEDRVRAAFAQRLLRGRVDVSIIREDPARRGRAVRVDAELARQYAMALEELRQALNLSDPVPLSVLLSLPDVIRVEESTEDPEALWTELQPAVEQCADRLVRMREAEGARLAQDLLERLDRIEGEVDRIAARAPEVVRAYAARLRRRVGELLREAGVPEGAVDEARLSMEVALFADRSDIREEVVRLRSHLAEARGILQQGAGSVGRKLEFLLQEMMREANTVGAKAGDLEIARAVLGIKSELEGLREQVQNLE
ncbi:MAG: YicC/YloC family endoribonuclease [Armatimonadota bacterium]|nr:YicC/YloC family endoribonuclease [Armatimonadota bacterium]MDR7445372.1 YicC/YloC family endoribonuclease [Armatimonadota bacterium]MDR7569741.1 YicC/YloC family endoribonuclease [Armatimonadota bacterium]MDR7614105.1 YicC/YloC family endoribonuclease [Armatimonadota bacterium]